MHNEAEKSFTRPTAHRSQELELVARKAALMTVREAATWIEERHGRRPGRTTIYAWVLAGVGGHRLASTILDGVLHVAEDDLANFCQTRGWPGSAARASRAGQPAPRRNRRITSERYLPNQQLLPLNWAEILQPEPCGSPAEQGPL